VRRLWRFGEEYRSNEILQLVYMIAAIVCSAAW